MAKNCFADFEIQNNIFELLQDLIYKYLTWDARF